MKSSTIFYKTLRWSVLEALITHGAYLAHQWALFNALDIEHFGVTQVLFSALYTLVNSSVLGFDASLTSSFTLIKSSRSLARTHLIMHASMSALIIAASLALM